MISQNDKARSRIICMLLAIPTALATGVAHGQLIAPPDPSGMLGGLIHIVFIVFAVLTAIYVSLVIFQAAVQTGEGTFIQVASIIKAVICLIACLVFYELTQMAAVMTEESTVDSDGLDLTPYRRWVVDIVRTKWLYYITIIGFVAAAVTGVTHGDATQRVLYRSAYVVMIVAGVGVLMCVVILAFGS